MFRPVAFLAMLTLCLGASECRFNDDDANVGEEEDVAFETLEYDDGTPAKGANSGVMSKRLVVVRDVNEFTELWNDHAANVIPQPALPDVDFGTDMVIGAFMGQQPTGGYAIEIEEIRENDAFMVVEVEMQTPGDNCVLTQATTQPFHIVLVPDTELPVQFSESTVEAAAC